jgi:hypothetical protein
MLSARWGKCSEQIYVYKLAASPRLSFYSDSKSKGSSSGDNIYWSVQKKITLFDKAGNFITAPTRALHLSLFGLDYSIPQPFFRFFKT